MTDTLLTPAPEPALSRKKIEQLRKNAATRLLTGSALVLKTWQLDMDWPPSAPVWLREQLSRLLLERTGKTLSPDKLYINFNSESDPAVEIDGHEHYSQRLSLTDLALALFDPSTALSLIQCAEADRPLDDTAPTLSTDTVIQLIMKARWAYYYGLKLTTFWAAHEATYCALAKLSFLKGVTRQYRQKKISRDGYHLALDVLGLKQFPGTSDDLERYATASQSTVSLLSLNGYPVPGLFQLQSKATSHCFVHVLGVNSATVEYISDDPNTMAENLLAAAHATPWLAPCLHLAHSQGEPVVNLGIQRVEGDTFAALTALQKAFSMDRLGADIDFQDDTPLLRPIEGGLRLVSSLDLWEAQPEILARIPTPITFAARTMRALMNRHFSLQVNPDQVFIRYLPGTSTTPLGNARVPVNAVHVPNEKPISLSEALVSNYRVEQPVGYIDNGGRTVIYSDPTGNGDWSEATELPIPPYALENHIRGLEFSNLMSLHINEFWDKQKETIERTLKQSCLAQAVLCLKQGTLSRTGFDLVTEAFNEASTDTQWVALGFFVQGSLFTSMEPLLCAGLLVLTDAKTPHRVLYQAGQPKAFVDFSDSEALNRYIEQAAGHSQWRQTTLNYVPTRYHPRLTYLLKIWAREQAPTPPVSLLRPWTDVIYNPDAHQAIAHSRHEQILAASPFAFMRETLQRNCLKNAQDQIVTSTEVSLNYWTQQLNHLQLLLAPMSFFLAPAALASLVTELGILSLNIVSANLPGSRQAEQKQALLTALTLGLLGLAPYTPWLLKSFNALTTPAKTAARTTTAVAHARGLGSLLKRSINARKTRLEKFFYTDSLLKTWNIPAPPHFGDLAVKTWKLERRFLLWTSETGQARTLVVSTHGYSLPWSKATAIPNGTELRTYTPAGYELLDPGLHHVVRNRVKAFSILNHAGNTLASTPNLNTPYVITNKLLAGTSRQGMIKNYSLAKFQSPDTESYQHICYVVRNSHQSPFHSQLMSTPMDVLSVRNRLGRTHPTLEDLFNALSEQGIHYDKILLLHCRCSAFKSLLGLAPTYVAP